MASKMRTNARKLGLRYQGDNGRLKFEKNGPTHKLWYSVLHGSKPRGGEVAKPFEDLIATIDEYGPLVWTSSNHELFQPGVHKEYPVALQWPEDRDKILSIFRQMYDQRESVHFAEEDTNHAKPTPKKKETPETPIKEKPWRAGPARSKLEVGVTCEIEDLFLTDIWMMTPDGQYAAALNLGTHRTIADLFAAIEAAFLSDNVPVNTRAILGSLQKLVVTFPNLGPNLRGPQSLSRSDRDQKLRDLRFNVCKGYDKYREDEDGEVVIGRAMAFFEHNNARAATA